MAEDVNQAIARYLRRIHDDVVRPVILERSSKQYRPDRLVSLRDVLMRAYFRAESLFKQPAKPHDDCGCKESAVRTMNLETMECQADEDCEENEKCIYGECVPIPFGLEFAPEDAQPSYGDEVSRAWEAYSALIYQALVQGLASKPRRLEAVRNELMRLYAEAAIAGGAVGTRCEETQSCADGQWCVDGFCVPIPFRLVFRGLPAARPEAWGKK